MDDIVQKNLFSKTITLSGGKTISKIEFLTKYTGSTTDLIEYYHKKVGNKQYFLKYHPASHQGAVIVINASTKVILDAECRIVVDMTKKELESFKKQKIND